MTDEKFAELEAQANALNKRWNIEAWSRRGAPDYRPLIKELLALLQEFVVPYVNVKEDIPNDNQRNLEI